MSRIYSISEKVDMYLYQSAHSLSHNINNRWCDPVRYNVSTLLFINVMQEYTAKFIELNLILSANYIISPLYTIVYDLRGIYLLYT